MADRQAGCGIGVIGARTDEQLADNLKAAELEPYRRGALAA